MVAIAGPQLGGGGRCPVDNLTYTASAMLTSVYRTLWRHRLLILLLTGVLVGTTWLLTERQTKLYTATTLVRVQQRVTQAEDVFGALQTGERLARVYVRIAETRSVAAEVRERLPASVPDDAIRIDAQQVSNLELLTLSVTNEDPQIAARVANAVPAALADFISQTGTSRDRIQTIERATAPSSPSSPKLTLNVAIALLLGLILSSGLVLLVENFSDRVEGAEEFERITGYPVIATIPSLKFVSLVRGRSERRTEQTDEELRVLVSGQLAATGATSSGATTETGRAVPGPQRLAARPPSRQALVDPGSPSAEPFRTLRLALQLRGDSGKGSAVLMTSAEPGAGKSTTAANFALVSALGRARVLLIDADLRKPVQHEVFGMSRSPGLVEFLASGGPLDRFAQRGPDRLDVLTAGREVPRAGDVLSSSRMRDLLAEAAGKYDMVVIDSSPVLASADAEGMSGHDVEVVFVVDRSSRGRDVVRAVRRLERLTAQIGGLVLNREGRQDDYGY
jgi:capsular exopolysaccharide synthesis family protein